MAPESDRKILAAAQGGDRDALGALLERHQERVYRFGMRMCGHPEDAEDVVQDTLLAAARSIQDFRGASSLSTWLYTIARSFCIKKRRRGAGAAETESLERDPPAGTAPATSTPATPDELAAAHEIGDALEAAIRALDDDQREVLLLRDVEGLSAAEVAEVTGISVAAVKSRLHRARLRVRERMAPFVEQAEPAPPDPGCPDVLTLYSKHLEGEISAAMCAEMERHLATCERCRSACDSLKHSLAACASAPSHEVPARVQRSVREALQDLLGS
jgi:RNA polymerase sigma-70 factor (ECF subfamily)